MSFSSQFLQQLQAKKKIMNEHYKPVKIDLEQIEHRTQIPAVKVEKQRLSITENQFIYLLKAAKAKFVKQPSLLKLQGPIYIATGTFGSYHELSLIFQKCGNPKFVNYVFLGDYTGKYSRGIECLVALLTYKLKSPSNFFLLRGGFQTIEQSKNSLFYQEVISFFSSAKVWLEICQFYCCLPFAATVNDKTLCLHGGINPFLFSLQQINQIKRPFDTPKKDLPHDLVFSYPQYGQNHDRKGTSQAYTQNDVQKFIKRTNLRLICRANSTIQQGFEYIFSKSVLNICSISNFCGFYSNSSAVAMIDDNFNVILKQIRCQTSVKSQESQQGLTFKQIVELRQLHKTRSEQIFKNQMLEKDSKS